MGAYLNPGNSGFTGIRNDIYVDKTGLIGLINKTIDTPRRLTCISRPRRFGKSFAAQMLCAYYDKTCDSSGLFDDLKIAGKDENSSTYKQHLNKYDVIYLDMTNIMGKAGAKNAVSFIQERVTKELLEAYPKLTAGNVFDELLIRAVELTGNKFIMIIDEWDAPIREVPEIEREYLDFLRMLFKGSGTTSRIFAAVYMTGILPIKKDGSQSAISDFQEFSMVFPMEYAEYAGFTEEEVKKLCVANGRDFSEMKLWYDGYTLEGAGSIYNPNSVMKALRNNKFNSYWTETSAAKSFMNYISLDFDGLSKTTAELLGGIAVAVDTNGFANDLVTFQSRDDVLTLLIHLGYLAYDEETKKVYIPNEEIRLEFAKAVRNVKHTDTLRRVRESDQLIFDTIHRNAEAVASQIQKIHAEETIGKPELRSASFGYRKVPSADCTFLYNDEQSLRSVIKLAYFSYKDHYLKFEELPAGDGYADIVYLPKKTSMLPALVIELKWNKSAEGAIEQIKDKRYPDAIKGYGGDILLVGVNYEKDASEGKRKHTCRIEKFKRQS